MGLGGNGDIHMLAFPPINACDYAPRVVHNRADGQSLLEILLKVSVMTVRPLWTTMGTSLALDGREV